MVIETAVFRNALRDFGHSLVPLSVALNSLMRGVIKNQPKAFCQPNSHNMMVLARGVEP
jgi:hypothetical protein